jgi:hypothetical protein
MHDFVQKDHRNIFLIWIDVDSPLTSFTSTEVICEEHLVPRQATSKISLVVLGEQTLGFLHSPPFETSSDIITPIAPIDRTKFLRHSE